jgi:hypothetical protein
MLRCQSDLSMTPTPLGLHASWKFAGAEVLSYTLHAPCILSRASLEHPSRLGDLLCHGFKIQESIIQSRECLGGELQ